jgi:hypothetical protein
MMDNSDLQVIFVNLLMIYGIWSLISIGVVACLVHCWRAWSSSAAESARLRVPRVVSFLALAAPSMVTLAVWAWLRLSCQGSEFLAANAKAVSDR